MPTLSKTEIAHKLKSLPAWTLRNGSLYRSLKFENFVKAFAFMTAAALESEKMNHHPDWSNSYNVVKISLQTHESQGITDLDFRLASKIEKLAEIFSAV